MDPNLDPRALAAQNSYWMAVLQRLGINPQSILGVGMAQQASQQLQGRPIQLQAQESQALGLPQAGMAAPMQGRGLLSF